MRWFFNKKKSKNTQTTIIQEQPKQAEDEIRDIQMEGCYEYGFSVLDIKETCNILEYDKARDKNNLQEFEENISSHALFKPSIHNISKKRIYVIKLDGKVYNIYSNDELFFIDERIWQENGHIDHHTIEIEKQSGHYTIHSFKHDEFLSTYFMKYYTTRPKNNDFDKAFRLDKESAKEIARSTISNLSSIPNIEKILDVDTILTRLFDSDGELLCVSEKQVQSLTYSN